MKILFLVVGLLITVGIGATVINSTSDHVALTFDSTQVCVPNEYVPDRSPLGEWLQENVSGLDSSGESEIIRLPASVIMEGVEGYQFSHINKYNVDLEHEISGIAHNISNVRNPHGEMRCEDAFDLGRCHQSIVYKDIYYQYTLQTVEIDNKEAVAEYLRTLFEKWHLNCDEQS